MTTRIKRPSKITRLWKETDNLIEKLAIKNNKTKTEMADLLIKEAYSSREFKRRLEF